MDEQPKRVRLKIDFGARTLELDAPAGEFDQAIEKTKELAEALATAARQGNTVQRPSPAPSAAETSGPASKVKARGAPRSSSGRPGRIGSFEPIRDLLSEEQHKELHAYVASKAPDEQQDQVLVAMHKGEQLLQRQGFSYNEIYTLMWRAGIEPLPKAIDVVIQRLIQEQKVDKNADGYFVKFLGQSRVEKDLPREVGGPSAKA